VPAPASPRVSAIVVTYRQVELTLAALASLEAQSRPFDELIVVDNDPEHSAREPVLAAHPGARVLNEQNIGYAPACNRGAAVATGDALFFLNPDAEAEPDCLERLLAVREEHPAARVVTPQVLMADGETINAGENRTHLTGITWCGRLGEPAETGPPRPVFVTTGAAMLVDAEHYRQVEGYCEEFFLYYEDPDLCWRTWIVGREVWFVPAARVRHHYHWGESTAKWFHLERNRLLSVLTNYRLSTLLVLAPLLLATELALLLVAGREGWRPEKLRAYASVWERRAWMAGRRRRLAPMRRTRDAELIEKFRAVVDSPQIESSAPRRAVPLLRLYRTAAVAAVRAIGR
jgi:GT2 family glycosyltransferase